MGYRKFVGAVLLAAFSSAAFAQAFPSKPVRLIIAFTPGSSTDIIGRVVAAKLQEMWGQPVVGENRVGAGGTSGPEGTADQCGETEVLRSAFRPRKEVNSRYDELHRSWRWEVPALYNIAEACCGRWAADRSRFALYWEDESGATATGLLL